MSEQQLFASLSQWRLRAETRAERIASLHDEDRWLAYLRVEPNVMLALLDVVEAAQEYRTLVLPNYGVEEEASAAEELSHALARFLEGQS